jgi:hypothetical protein
MQEHVRERCHSYSRVVESRHRRHSNSYFSIGRTVESLIPWYEFHASGMQVMTVLYLHRGHAQHFIPPVRLFKVYSQWDMFTLFL